MPLPGPGRILRGDGSSVQGQGGGADRAALRRAEAGRDRGSRLQHLPLRSEDVFVDLLTDSGTSAPLLMGGFAVGALGVRALWLRWDLVERLSGERDAYVISEVLAFASQEATMERRHSFALVMRSKLTYPETGLEGRITAAAQELEALACELEDDELSLDPASAVACMRLLSDVSGSC